MYTDSRESHDAVVSDSVGETPPQVHTGTSGDTGPVGETRHSTHLRVHPPVGVETSTAKMVLKKKEWSNWSKAKICCPFEALLKEIKDVVRVVVVL